MAEYLNDPEEEDGQWKELLDLLSVARTTGLTPQQRDRMDSLISCRMDAEAMAAWTSTASDG
jgi:hypothetical protein